MAYKSPINFIIGDIQYHMEKATEQTIVKAVQHYFPLVDEEELAKALRYDRNQYAAGFVDGRAARDAEIVRCKDCEYYTAEEKWCRRLGLCGAFNEDGFCSKGERRDDG